MDDIQYDNKSNLDSVYKIDKSKKRDIKLAQADVIWIVLGNVIVMPK